MKTYEYCWKANEGWEKQPSSEDIKNVSLIVVFGATEIITEGRCINELQQAFPEAQMIGCSTGGEIFGTSVSDGHFVATAISFATSQVHAEWVFVSEYENSGVAAKALLEKIPSRGLRHLFVLADGVLTDASELVRGINEVVSPTVSVTGGMAGDGLEFSSAYVIFNGQVQQSAIAAVGFYGDDLKVGYGSCGGWIPFGPERLITASNGDTMYELDGQSVLNLYKQYLGKEAENLPAAGVLFPLSVMGANNEAVVRTVKSVDDRLGSLSFVGDVPTGNYARFMRAVPDDLIDGAAEAAEITKGIVGENPSLCILISCVGRKAVLKQLAEEETEVISECFSNNPVIIGFYSYGEIAPFGEGLQTILHNQTMTITAISEESNA